MVTPNELRLEAPSKPSTGGFYHVSVLGFGMWCFSKSAEEKHSADALATQFHAVLKSKFILLSLPPMNFNICF